MAMIDKPTVLLVGSGERMKDALAAALERHRLLVESVDTESAVDAAFAAAPDLLVLIGDATVEGGRAVLARLGESPVTATVPVVLLTEEAGLDRTLSAFKHGVVAVVQRTASADGMARRIADISRELPERSGETGGQLGEASVDELVELFSQQLRTGILSVSSGAGDASAQVVLSEGRPVTEAIEELVERLRPLVAGGDGSPLRYEFHESTSARLTLLESEEAEPEDGDLLRDRRVVLVEQNPARADVLVQELRARGALVVVADGEGNGLERARGLDPEVVILDGSGVHGWALPAMRTLRRDPHLRWASLLVVDAAGLWPGGAAAPDLARLTASLKPLVRADRELAERARSETAFDTRLEVIGPARTLRALTTTGLGLRVSVSHPRARVEVDLAEGLVAGARAIGPTGRELAQGPAALAAVLAISSGRVRVERKDAPAVANVMAPLDDALAAAANERAPIQASIPPPSGSSEPPAPGEVEGVHDADRLIGRLEELLERLQRVLPAAEAAAAQVEEPPTRKRQAVPRRAKVVPPPKAGLPPARREAATQTRAQSDDDDDDLPEIEATAEPGVATSAPLVPKPASQPAQPHVPPPFEPAAAPEARASESISASGPHHAVSHPSGQHPPAPYPSGQHPALPSGQHPAASHPSGPHPSAQPPSVHPSGPYPSLPTQQAATPEHAPVNVWDETPVERAATPRRGRGLLWFAVAFALTLLVGGGAAAAYLYLERAPEPTVRLPTAPADPPPAPEPPQPPTELRVASAPADAGSSAVELARAADAGVRADAGAPVIGDAGSRDAGPRDGGLDGGAGALLVLAPTSQEPAEEELEEEEIEEEPPAGGDSRSERIAHLVRVANFQRNQGNLVDAEQSYQAVLRIDRSNARALAGLVRLNMSRGTNDQALRWARRLVAARPRNAANHVLLGDVLAATGNRRAAEASWRRALELSPSLRSARRRLAGP